MLGKFCQVSGELSLELEHPLGMLFDICSREVLELVKSLGYNYDKLDRIHSDLPANLDSSTELVGT